MEIADQQASQNSASTTTTTTTAVNPEKFNSFLKQNPTWNFYEISKSDYLMMPENKKMQLIDCYYKHMNDGKSKFIFNVMFDLSAYVDIRLS